MTNPTIYSLLPAEVRDLLERDAVFLIDVREPAEFARERIPGAFLYPLSSFDAKDIPEDPSRPTVFCCGSGKRSLDAAKRYTARHPEATHLGGGVAAWKQAGLPLITE